MMGQLLLLSLQEVLIPEMKWRKVCPASRSLSLPDSIPCIPRASMGSPDSSFPSRKPPRSGEFRGLVHSGGAQKPGFSPYFCEKGPSQPAGLLRAVPFFLRESVGQAKSPAGALPVPGRKVTNCSLTAENAVCEQEALAGEPRSNEELKLWNYRLLKVFFVL